MDEIPQGEALRLDASQTGTVDIAVFHTDEGEFFALDDICTHEEASLAEGWLEGDTVECPMHAASFCLRTGKALTLPATVDEPTHRVEVRGDEVFLYPGVPAQD